MVATASISFRSAVTAFCLAAMGGGGVASAGEKVTFSDNDRRPTTSTADPRKDRRSRAVDRENPLGGFAPGGSSLDGVMAPPFAPSVAAPEASIPLTEKELRLLDQRQNWIFRTPADLQRDHGDAHTVFGVRERESGAPGTRSETGGSRARLVDYYDRLGREREAGASGGVNTPRDSQTGPDRPGQASPVFAFPEGLSRNDGSLAPVHPPGFGDPASSLTPPGVFTSTDTTFSDPDGRRASPDSDWARPDWTRSGPSFRESPVAPPFPVTDRPLAEQLTGVSRILGASPIGNPLSSLDPVTAYPDPTREPLNPVIGRPVNASARPLGTLPSGNESPQAGGRTAPFSTSPAILATTPGLTGTGPGRTADSAAPERRTLQSMKVNLDMPRRAF